MNHISNVEVIKYFNENFVTSVAMSKKLSVLPCQRKAVQVARFLMFMAIFQHHTKKGYTKKCDKNYVKTE